MELLHWQYVSDEDITELTEGDQSERLGAILF